MRTSRHAAAAVLTIVFTCPLLAQAEPLFLSKDIFVSGLEDHNIYRIPSLLITEKGTLLAFCEGREGDDGSLTDLVLKRSHDNGMSWQPMQTVLEGNNTAWMNACPVIDRSDGTIFLFCYKVSRADDKKHISKPFNDANRILYLKSVDDGATWSTPVDLTASVGLLVPGPGVGIQLQSGRLAVPCYDQQSSMLMYSDDHGDTWQIGARVKTTTNEAQVVERVDGSLMLNMRCYKTQKCRYVAISHDAGQTWDQEYYDETLIDSENQASLLRYTAERNGYKKNRILFSNTAHRRSRVKMTVRLSYDEGRTWPVSRELHAGPAGYSCMAVLQDGTIGIFYETGESGYKDRIAFSRFNLEWLTAGADRLAPSSKK